jgi:hypothetical protein
MTHQHALDTMAAERYLLDEMTEVEKHAFEDHFFDCGDCAEEVRRGELIRQEVRRAPRGAGVAAQSTKFVAFPKRPVWQRPSVVIPWAAAATLAVAVGYQSLVTVPGLRRVIAPQSLSPVMLREATRGTVPVVAVSRGQRFVTIGVDVTTTSSSRDVRYDLLDTAGNTLLSGQTPLPPSGVPLLLLLPADELGGPGRHTLILRDPGSSGVALGEYSFDLAN